MTTFARLTQTLLNGQKHNGVIKPGATHTELVSQFVHAKMRELAAALDNQLSPINACVFTLAGLNVSNLQIAREMCTSAIKNMDVKTKKMDNIVEATLSLGSDEAKFHFNDDYTIQAIES